MVVEVGESAEDRTEGGATADEWDGMGKVLGSVIYSAPDGDVVLHVHIVSAASILPLPSTHLNFRDLIEQIKPIPSANFIRAPGRIQLDLGRLSFGVDPVAEGARAKGMGHDHGLIGIRLQNLKGVACVKSCDQPEEVRANALRG